jgi:2-polyprenyl-6-methoxyphenol hydroxylase-like FAD-dependent oxidoreductase
MPASAKQRSALVIGGSIGGLIAALLLRRDGWKVTICERSPVKLAGRGAGIVTHRELWDSLFVAGIPRLSEDGVAVEERSCLSPDGQEIVRLPFSQLCQSWDALFSLVREPWGEADYHLGQELVEIEQDANSVTARFADGSSRSADLLIGADGFRSTVRSIVAPEVQPIYAGYVGWRGMVEEADLPRDTHAQLFHLFGFCLPKGEQIVVYPVTGEDGDKQPGHRRGNFVWYRPVAPGSELDDLLTDAAGVTHKISIPPPLIRTDHVARLRADAERLLAKPFAAWVAHTEAPFLQPIYDFESEHLGFGRVVLVGDAAFQARPHIGAGVTKAAQDAIALAAALRGQDDLGTALRDYEAVRVPAGKAVVQRARYLGAGIDAALPADKLLTPAIIHTPLSVVKETATLEF